jgi:hypothetical protein
MPGSFFALISIYVNHISQIVNIAIFVMQIRNS